MNNASIFKLLCVTTDYEWFDVLMSKSNIYTHLYICVWLHLCLITFVFVTFVFDNICFDYTCVFLHLFLITLVFDNICVWLNLCLISFVFNIICVWLHLCLITFVFDYICVLNITILLCLYYCVLPLFPLFESLSLSEWAPLLDGISIMCKW